jgi:hypothetical protein
MNNKILLEVEFKKTYIKNTKNLGKSLLKHLREEHGFNEWNCEGIKKIRIIEGRIE